MSAHPPMRSEDKHIEHNGKLKVSWGKGNDNRYGKRRDGLQRFHDYQEY